MTVAGRRNVQVSVFDDQEALSRGAAELFYSLSRTAVASHGRFVVALSGGTTPQRLYTLLGAPPYQTAIDWRRIHLFWADERCVPPDHPESNYKLVRDRLLKNVSLEKNNVHRVQGECDPGEAARAYEQGIKEFFGTESLPGFDLIILGVGADGHTASLFPGSTAVAETARIAVPVYLAPPQLNRVTLTLPVINRAVQVLFLAAGRAKAVALHNILYQENSLRYPAGLVRPVHGAVSWFLDAEAAGHDDAAPTTH